MQGNESQPTRLDGRRRRHLINKMTQCLYVKRIGSTRNGKDFYDCTRRREKERNQQICDCFDVKSPEEDAIGGKGEEEEKEEGDGIKSIRMLMMMMMKKMKG